MKTALVARRSLLIIIVIISIVKILFTITTSLGLFSEEAQYWLWSQNLDWNYYSKPLMVAVNNFISTSIMGHTDLAVRINAVLYGAATVWVIFELALLMFKNPKIAFWSGITLVVMPFFHLASFFHTTDTSLVFFWALSFYFFWRAIEENRMVWWGGAGLATALGMLSKNVMFLSIPAIVVYLLMIDPKKLIQKGFYFYLFGASLSLLPILFWNYQHDFVTFKHLGTLGGVQTFGSPLNWGDTFKNVSEFVLGQGAIISVFFIPLLILIFKRGGQKREKEFYFLLLPAFMSWLLFFGISFLNRVEVNWPSFAYVQLSICFGWLVANGPRFWKKYIKVATLISAGFLVFIMNPSTLDAFGYKRILRPEKDPLARLAGYREIGKRVDFLKDSLDLKQYFIFSDNYHFASEMAFYVSGNPQTYVINLGRRKNQFDLWAGISQFENKGYSGIFVHRGKDEIPAVQNGFNRLIYQEIQYPIYRGDTIRIVRIAIYEGLTHIKEVQVNRY
ncbi:glycosyltransferase family 39 protein [Echinicola jeungdonensis]|uniref:ArnT family glycosyltransferase n=1 Tax=Echinicola jeungdonensis TaxID=709343 RepID=A0ABV5J5R1_9BACT|nr:glycosyltransferase family 39 protein [Echinicola jeungdonensis]MDN3668832.1 glycosyltransferase family 39 protein [Echinicola jeungdonensis]